MIESYAGGLDAFLTHEDVVSPGTVWLKQQLLGLSASREQPRRPPAERGRGSQRSLSCPPSLGAGAGS